MTYVLKSPLALYRALREANIPPDLAREAAFAIGEDLEAMLKELLAQAAATQPTEIRNPAFPR